MGLAYGTPFKIGDDLDKVRAAAVSSRLFGEAREWVFRVKAVRYSTCHLTEYDAEVYGSTDARLELFAFDVFKWTDYGATLYQHSGARRQWVDLRPGHKQWASRTVEQAVAQFARRRVNQIRILERQLARAKAELELTRPHLLAMTSPVAGGS